MRELLEYIMEGIKDAYARFVDTDKVPEDIFNKFVQRDPSRKGKYVEWMCKQYVSDPNRHGHIIDVARLFDQLAQKKKIKQTDIYQYDLEGAEQAIEDVRGVKSKGEIRTGIKKDADKVFENDEWMVISPKTYEAACYYGKNTKWCISGRIRDHWDSYTMQGVKFYVVIDKKQNKKYAVAVYLSGEKEIYDELDKLVPQEEFDRIFKI